MKCCLQGGIRTHVPRYKPDIRPLYDLQDLTYLFSRKLLLVEDSLVLTQKLFSSSEPKVFHKPYADSGD
jgi:hypothetical protein